MTLNERFPEWFCGDEQAGHFAALLWTASQAWDDLEDEGQADDMNAAISFLAFGKEYHPFFARHAAVLRPALLGFYLDWRAANEMERSAEGDDRAMAWMLRAGFYRVLHMMAWCCGGDDHAARVGPAIWRSYGEPLAGFLEEMEAAHG